MIRYDMTQLEFTEDMILDSKVWTTRIRVEWQQVGVYGLIVHTTRRSITPVSCSSISVIICCSVQFDYNIILLQYCSATTCVILLSVVPFISITSFFLDCFYLDTGSIGNNRSTSEVEIRSAYALPSTKIFVTTLGMLLLRR